MKFLKGKYKLEICVKGKNKSEKPKEKTAYKKKNIDNRKNPVSE